MNEKIRKQKLKKFKSTHLTKIGYNLLRKEKQRLKNELGKDNSKSMMELNEIAIIKTYGEK